MKNEKDICKMYEEYCNENHIIMDINNNKMLNYIKKNKVDCDYLLKIIFKENRFNDFDSKLNNESSGNFYINDKSTCVAENLTMIRFVFF